MGERLHDVPPQPEPGSTTLRHWLLLAGIALTTILVDQLAKAYVVAHLPLHDSWMPLEFIRPVFKFTHVHNTGAAFGLFPDGGLVFLVIAVVVSTIILFFYRQLVSGQWLVRLALGLQLGGALGNVVDRVRLGYVVDFFHVEFWPVFNVADSAIVIGVLLLGFEMWREERRLQAAQAHAESRSDHQSPRESPDEHTIYG